MKTSKAFIHRLLFLMIFLLAIVSVCFASGAPAVLKSSNESIDWFTLAMGFFGGLALFLAGMDFLADGLRKAAGDALKVLLKRLTSNRFMGAITGALVTGVLNSSSVTTVLVVGFVTAGVMSLTQAVGVIMGANIGTTVTAQLLAFNISHYALIGVASGFFINFIVKNERTKYYGLMIMGLGLVFYGMGLMSGAMYPLRNYAPFIDLLKQMEHPLLGIAVGALFTAVVQSSSAAVGVAITLASQGLLTLPSGIALALGANIGTCVTALLASLGKPVDAVRAAVVHVLFNVIGVLIWIAFIPQLSDLAIGLSHWGNHMFGFSVAASNVPRQLANANTLFNIVNTLIFIGFTPYFAKVAMRLVPDRGMLETSVAEAKFLDEEALVTPDLALNLVRLEIGHAGEIVEKMYFSLKPAVRLRQVDMLEEIARYDDQVDVLEKLIFDYLGEMRKQSLTKEESRIHQDLMAAVVNLEHLADMIEEDLVNIGEDMIEKDYQPSEKTAALMDQLYEMIGESVQLGIRAVSQNDEQAANDVIHMKKSINKLSDKVLKRKSKRLGRGTDELLRTARMEISYVDKLQRIYTLAKRLGKEAGTAVPAES